MRLAVGGRWPPPYGPRAFWLDVGGGLASSVVTLPLSLGLALASGLPLQYGLYSAIVGGFVASLTTSQSEVAGPSAACVVVVAQVFTRIGPWGLALFTAATVPVPVLGGVVLAHILLAACWSETRQILRLISRAATPRVRTP
jgi:SulP family sulfate permease